MSEIIRITDEASKALDKYLKSGMHAKVLRKYSHRKKIEVASDLIIDRIEQVYKMASQESAQL